MGSIILSTETVNFVVLDPEAAIEASDIATETGVRGMDAIVIQTAKDYKTTLISLDAEMMTKAADTVRIRYL